MDDHDHDLEDRSEIALPAWAAHLSVRVHGNRARETDALVLVPQDGTGRVRQYLVRPIPPSTEATITFSARLIVRGDSSGGRGCP